MPVFNPRQAGYAAPMKNSTTTDTTRESRVQAVYTTLQCVPKGKVISYGDLARLSGLPGYARFIGRVLRELPKGTALPWHRVIRASGQIAFPMGSAAYQRQKNHLEEEGVKVINGRVAMKAFRWQF